MSNFVKRIEAIGIHGRFDYSFEFKPGVNIIYGKNGTGKTTLIHILANALNAEFSRFAYLDFKSIKINLDDTSIVIERKDLAEDNEHIVVKIKNKSILSLPIQAIIENTAKQRPGKYTTKQLNLFEDSSMSSNDLQHWLELTEDDDERKPFLETSYFPAFRTMIDAWVSSQQQREQKFSRLPWTALATKPARSWFGEFVPYVNFPSLIEIEQRLTEEIQQARLMIGRADRELLSKAFLEIFSSLSEGSTKDFEQPDKILTKIKGLFDRLEQSPLQEESSLVTKVYSELRKSIHNLDSIGGTEKTVGRVLNVYRDLLEQVVMMQERSFAGIQQYLESVNEFLEKKQLFVEPSISFGYRRGAVGINFDDYQPMLGLRALSSGERQIVTMIYAATHMSKQKVVLIDEPEISLHVDWQRKLLSKMAQQIGDRQIIACTHSPVIGADYEDRQNELEAKPTKSTVKKNSNFEDEEEIPF